MKNNQYHMGKCKVNMHLCYVLVSSCKDSAGYHGGGQSEEKCKESNSWNAKGEGGREQGRQGAEKRSVDRLVLAVSVFVVGARPFDRPETILPIT